MSYHNSSNSSRRVSSAGSSAGFPTKWSAWEWSDEHECHQRYRQMRPGNTNYDYEWQYSNVQPTPPTEPRTSSLDPILETDQHQEYPSLGEYTTPAPLPGPVDEITHNLDQIRIASPPSSFGSYNAPGYTPAAEITATFGRYIKTRNPNTSQEEFDRHYKVHDSWQFKWGRVFKVLWAEPSGNNGEDGTVGGKGTLSVRKTDGKKIHEKVRRFVIINALEGHCICLPIMTYAGQGVLRRGVQAKHHAAIYSGDEARVFKGEKEKGMTKRPIRIMTNPRHRLDKASRLNYAKLYTVEHNVKVWFIGHVHKNSEWQLGTDYNEVHPPLRARGVPPPPDDTFALAQVDLYKPTTAGLGGNYNPYTLYQQNNSLFPASSGAFQSQPFSSTGLAPTSWSPGESQYLTGSTRRPSYPVAGGPSYDRGDSSHAGDDERSSHISRRASDYNVDYNVDYSEHTADVEDFRKENAVEETYKVSSDETSSVDPPYFPSGVSYDSRYQNYTEEESQDISYDEARRAAVQQLTNQEIDQDPELEVSEESRKYKPGENKLTGTNDFELDTLRIVIDDFTKLDNNPKDDLYDASEPEDGHRKVSNNDSEAAPDLSQNDLFVEPIMESNGTKDLQHNLIEAASEEATKTQISEGDATETLEQHATYRPTSLPGSSTETGYNSAVDRPVMSRSSSLYSLQSLIFSSHSVSSKSSISAYPPYIDNGARILAFLSNDSQLQVLFNDVTRKVSLDRFEKNFRRCLQQFSEHLRIEGKRSPLLRDASTVVRHFSTNTAHSIRRVLEEDGFKESRNPTLNLPQEIETSDDEDDEYDRYDEYDENTEDDEGDESHGIDADKELEEASIPNLEQALRDSNAFQMLRDNLRLFLNPNQAERAVFEAWAPEQPRSLPDELIHNIEWELVHFLDTNYEQQQALGRIFTLSGQDDNAQAATCQLYLEENWPEAGPLLLEAIEEFLIIRDNVSVENDRESISILPAQHDEGSKISKFQIVVNAQYNFQVQITAAISWLGATCRLSKFDDISRSFVIIKADSAPDKKQPGIVDYASKTIRYSLLDLEPVASDKSCWHGLFPQGVLAYGFPTRPRHGGLGLEISFAEMAIASRCLSFVEYDCGLIAHGLTSLLIPIVELEKDNAVQWHFENKTKQFPNRLCRVSQIMSSTKFKGWYRELCPENLVTRRCFLGLTKSADVVIGTKGYQANFGFSGAPKVGNSKALHVTSQLFTGGSGDFGYMDSAGRRVLLSTSAQSMGYSQLNQDIRDVVDNAQDHLVLLYDTKNEIGWYLPQASVVLHMAHAKISMKRYQFYDDDGQISDNDSTAFSTLSSDGWKGASDAIKMSLGLKVRKQYCPKRGPIEEDFGSFVRKAWHTLDNVEANLVSKEPQFQSHPPHSIHGVEYVHALNEESSIRMHIKEAIVDQAWAYLTYLEPIVIFTKDIPPPIALDTLNLCKAWMNVPSGQKYLVAMGTAAQSFFDQQDAGIAEGVSWEVGKELIQPHELGCSTPIFHVQKLRVAHNTRPNEPILAAIAGSVDSYLVFGNNSGKECLEALGGPEPSSPEEISIKSAPRLDDSVSDFSSPVNEDPADGGDSSTSELSQDTILGSCRIDVPHTRPNEIYGSTIESTSSPELANVTSILAVEARKIELADATVDTGSGTTWVDTPQLEISEPNLKERIALRKSEHLTNLYIVINKKLLRNGDAPNNSDLLFGVKDRVDGSSVQSLEYAQDFLMVWEHAVLPFLIEFAPVWCGSGYTIGLRRGRNPVAMVISIMAEEGISEPRRLEIKQHIRDILPTSFHDSTGFIFRQGTIEKLAAELDDICEPQNPYYYYEPMMGDSVGISLGEGDDNSTSTLGPRIVIGQNSFWLVNFHPLEDAALGRVEGAINLTLEHPSPNDRSICLKSRHEIFKTAKSNFTLGTVAAVSGANCQATRRSSNPYWTEVGLDPQNIVVDWALCSASSQQVNFLRIPAGIEEGPTEPITSHCDVFSGAPVYSTGRTSGLKRGSVCLSPEVVSPKINGTGIITREWFVEEPYPYDDETRWTESGIGVSGDSGAAIIDSEKEAICGQLWGRNMYEKSQSGPRITYFTPITDLFDDIQEKYSSPARPELPQCKGKEIPASPSPPACIKCLEKHRSRFTTAPTAQTESGLEMASEEPLMKHPVLMPGTIQSFHLEDQQTLVFCQTTSLDLKLLGNPPSSNNKISNVLLDKVADRFKLPPYTKNIDHEELMDTEVRRSYSRRTRV